MDELCKGKFWDVNLTWYTETPHFTPCFRETVLVWIPCAFLWIFLPLQICNLNHNRYGRIPWNWFNIIKLSSIITVAVFILLRIGLYLMYVSSEPEIFFYSTILLFVTYVLFFILTYCCLVKGVRSSGVLLTFSFLCVICELPSFVPVIKNWNSFHVRYDFNFEKLSILLNYALNVLIFILNCFADGNPDFPLKFNSKDKNTENISILSDLFSLWMEPYVWRNFKNPANSILWNYCFDDDTDCILSEKVKSAKQFTLNSNCNSAKKMLRKKYGLLFIRCTLLKMTYEGMGISLIVIFGFLLSAIANKEPTWRCYFYLVIFFSSTILQVIIHSYYWKLFYKLEIQLNRSLIPVLYDKALRISSKTRIEYTTTDIIDLMSLDISRIQTASKDIHLLFSLIIQLISSYGYCWVLLGPTIFINVIVLILFLMITCFATIYMKKLQKKEIQYKNKCNKFIQELLNGIKIIKMYAWENSFRNIVLNLRKKEERNLNKIGYLYVLFQVFLILTPFVLCVVAYASLVVMNSIGTFSIVIIFSTSAVFNSFRIIMNTLPYMSLNIQQGLMSLERIEKFLSSEELDRNAVSRNSSVKSALFLHNASFSWISITGPAVLFNLNVQIEKGELVAVVGSIGAGKSSFISAFLGEMYKLSGIVNTKGKIAFVPQTAWILNATFKDNIILYREINNELYENILDVCALRSDINAFSGKDLTEIGEKGINLSGGQKQRISLARAIYQDADVYFFDDPLSALDSSVAAHIFHNALSSDSILKEKTRILVTHSAEFIPYVDKIIVLNNGHITEVGTYNDLRSRGVELAEFVKHPSEVSKNTEENKYEEFINVMKPNNFKNGEVSDVDVSKNLVNYDIEDEQNLKERKNLDLHKIIIKECVETNQVHGQLYCSYIATSGICLTVSSLIFFALAQGFLILSNVWICVWLRKPDLLTDKYFYLSIYGCFGLCIMLSSWLGNICLFKATLKVSAYLCDKLSRNILLWPMPLFDTIPIGRILSRFNDDMYVLDNCIGMNLGQSIMFICKFFSIAILLVCIIPQSIPMIMLFIVIFFIIQILYVSMFRQMKKTGAIYKSPLYSHFAETISGFQSIRAYKLEQKFKTLTKEKNDLCLAVHYSSALGLKWLFNRCETIGAIFYLCLGIIVIMHKDDLNITYLAVGLMFGLQVLRGINIMMMHISLVEDNILSFERIEQYSKNPKEPYWDCSTREDIGSWPIKGDIVFQNYKLRYRPGLECVLKGISFNIKSGEKIGIIGRTGAGKSSIFLGLFRIIEPAEGSILIDNVDITHLSLYTLRSKITIIPQDPTLFSGTLRINLDPFNCYDDKELWNALEKAHLKAYIDGLKDGLNYLIEEGGRNLSFGQRQLICLARALLRKNKILVLDEATASVDTKTDELIQNTIFSEFSECTVITIAHRLNTLQNYDKILILDNGKIVRYETPENLGISKSPF